MLVYSNSMDKDDPRLCTRKTQPDSNKATSISIKTETFLLASKWRQQVMDGFLHTAQWKADTTSFWKASQQKYHCWESSKKKNPLFILRVYKKEPNTRPLQAHLYNLRDKWTMVSMSTLSNSCSNKPSVKAQTKMKCWGLGQGFSNLLFHPHPNWLSLCLGLLTTISNGSVQGT